MGKCVLNKGYTVFCAEQRITSLNLCQKWLMRPWNLVCAQNLIGQRSERCGCRHVTSHPMKFDTFSRWNAMCSHSLVSYFICPFEWYRQLNVKRWCHIRYTQIARALFTSPFHRTHIQLTHITYCVFQALARQCQPQCKVPCKRYLTRRTLQSPAAGWLAKIIWKSGGDADDSKRLPNWNGFILNWTCWRCWIECAATIGSCLTASLAISFILEHQFCALIRPICFCFRRKCWMGRICARSMLIYIPPS